MARRGRSRKPDAKDAVDGAEEQGGEERTVESVANELSERLLEIAKEMVQSGSATTTPVATSVAKAAEGLKTPGGSGSKNLWSDEVERVEAGNPKPDLPPGGGNQQRKWVDVLQGNRDKANGWTLNYSPPLVGKNVVTISPEEKAEGCEVWKNALVGFVLGAKPRFKEMVNYANARWRRSGNPVVHMLQEGIFLFDFCDEEGKDRILEQNWTYWGKPLILKPWEPNMDLRKLDVEKVPVWIQLHQLPLDYWTPKILSKIASFIGNPLATDKLTARRERLAYARVLVEMKVSGGLVFQIPVADGEEGFMQDVYYEWLPVKCSRCAGYGHEKQNCTLPERKEWVAKQTQMETETEVEVPPKENAGKGKDIEEVVQPVEEIAVVIPQGGKGEQKKKKPKATQTQLPPKVNPPAKKNIQPGKKTGQSSPTDSDTRKMAKMTVEGNQVTVYLPPNG